MGNRPQHQPKLQTLAPAPVRRGLSIVDLVETTFWGHNARSLRDACALFQEMAAQQSCLIGLSLGGALTPVGLGESVLVPMIQANLIDWIVATGANLYHDIHGLLGHEMSQCDKHWDDRRLRDEGLIRIHNIVFDQQALLDTDNFLQAFFLEFREKLAGPKISTPTLCKALGDRLMSLSHLATQRSILAAAADLDVPIFCPAIADSSIGMNLAALTLRGTPLCVDPILDVNQSAALVYAAKREGHATGSIILGGGVAKNFQLQTEPHIQEVLGLPEKGHDYFIQITDARVDTGGLSGATPSEAVTWGKVDPEALPRTVVCHSDCTLALPVLGAHTIERGFKRAPKRLLEELEASVRILHDDHVRT